MAAFRERPLNQHELVFMNYMDATFAPWLYLLSSNGTVKLHRYIEAIGRDIPINMYLVLMSQRVKGK